MFSEKFHGIFQEKRQNKMATKYYTAGIEYSHIKDKERESTIIESLCDVLGRTYSRFGYSVMSVTPVSVDDGTACVVMGHGMKVTIRVTDHGSDMSYLHKVYKVTVKRDGTTGYPDMYLTGEEIIELMDSFKYRFE